MGGGGEAWPSCRAPQAPRKGPDPVAPRRRHADLGKAEPGAPPRPDAYVEVWYRSLIDRSTEGTSTFRRHYRQLGCRRGLQATRLDDGVVAPAPSREVRDAWKMVRNRIRRLDIGSVLSRGDGHSDSHGSRDRHAGDRDVHLREPDSDLGWLVRHRPDRHLGWRRPGGLLPATARRSGLVAGDERPWWT